MNETGKPQVFNADAWLDYVEQLICADEVELALKALDTCPSYYREHVPERALEIRESLHRALWTPVQYAGIYKGAEVNGAEALGAWSLRFAMLDREVERMNVDGQTPHIMELAPGAMIAKEGMRSKGRKFHYSSLSLEGPRFAECMTYANDFPQIFVAFELIEHLSNPQEIYQNYLKFNREADVIMLSTPLHTYNGGWPSIDKWRGQALGHLRAYSVQEFASVAAKMFQGYQWECATDEVIVLIGRR